MYHLFIHSSVDGHLGCFHVLAVVNSAAGNIGTLLYSKWITNKDLLCRTGNSAQCYVPVWMGGGWGENGHTYACMCAYIYMCIYG